MVFNIQEIDLAVIGHETETPHEEGKQQRSMGGGGPQQDMAATPWGASLTTHLPSGPASL